MKTGAKIGIVAVVIIVLLMCCCLTSAAGWFFVLGPGSYKTADANKIVVAVNKSYLTAVDESDAINTQLSEVGSKVTDTTDPQAITDMEDELLKSESKAQEILDNLAEADKKLADAKNLSLPDWYIQHLSLLTKRQEAASSGVTSLMNGLAEARKMIGAQSYFIDAIDRETDAFASVENGLTKIGGSDFIGAQADLAAAESSLAAADTALDTANEKLQSKDIDDLIEFNQSFHEYIALLSQFASAGLASDLNTMLTLQDQLTTKQNEITTEADNIGANQDYKTWFESMVKKYQDEYDAKMKEASQYDAQAKELRAKNGG